MSMINKAIEEEVGDEWIYEESKEDIYRELSKGKNIIHKILKTLGITNYKISKSMFCVDSIEYCINLSSEEDVDEIYEYLEDNYNKYGLSESEGELDYEVDYKHNDNNTLILAYDGYPFGDNIISYAMQLS